jgi:hypothetical protein
MEMVHYQDVTLELNARLLVAAHRRHRPRVPEDGRWKDRFKILGVKKGIPIMEMVHYQNVTLELNARLLVAAHRRHRPRVPEDGRWLGQQPLCIQHEHLVHHLHNPGFGGGASCG